MRPDIAWNAIGRYPKGAALLATTSVFLVPNKQNGGVRNNLFTPAIAGVVLALHADDEHRVVVASRKTSKRILQKRQAGFVDYERGKPSTIDA